MGLVSLTWWCSATTRQWDWTFQAYPGVWVFMAVLLGGYLYAWRVLGPRHLRPGEVLLTGRQASSFAAAFALLWLATDWPVGALGAGYLLTAHMIQYVIYSLIAAPLLVHGLSRPMRRAILAQPFAAPWRAAVGHTFPVFLAFNVVLAVTHLPIVMDTLKPLQFGSMAMDVVWLVVAVAFWWALTDDLRERGTDHHYGRRLLYIIAITMLPTLPSAFFVFAEFPIYATFELAPRAVDLGALEDQQVAGLLMWVGTTPIVLARIALSFFQWSQAEAAARG